MGVAGRIAELLLYLRGQIFRAARPILMAGCHGISDYQLLRRVISINAAIAIAITAATICLSLFALAGQYHSILTMLPSIVLYGLPALLNHLRRYEASRFSFIILTNLAILYGVVIAGKDSGMPMIFMTALAMTHMLYSSKEMKELIFFTLLSIGLLFFVEVGPESWTRGILSFDGELNDKVRFILLFANIVALAVACYTLHSSIDQLQYQVVKEEEGKIEENKLSALGLLSAGIAHEINNPLAIITCRSEQIIHFLRTGTLSRDRLISLLQNVGANAERIAKIIKSLKSLARSSVNDSYAPYALHEIISDSLELCRENIFRHNIVLNYERGSKDFQVSCHPSELMQVFLNLVTNAIEAIAALPERWIHIDVSEDAGQSLIRITDSGRGIAVDLQAKIMQPFFTTKEIGKGSGLGLSLAATIVSRHGGQLDFDPSTPHTCFVVMLPRAATASSPAPEFEAAS